MEKCRCWGDGEWREVALYRWVIGGDGGWRAVPLYRWELVGWWRGVPLNRWVIWCDGGGRGVPLYRLDVMGNGWRRRVYLKGTDVGVLEGVGESLCSG